MKKCSCGFILVDNQTGHWLLVHPPGKDVWDFPKGWAAQGETHLSAAVRELREETGVILSAAEVSNAHDFGQHPFTEEKDMRLYLARVSLNPAEMFCMSMVTNPSGPDYPEVDEFRLVPPAEVNSMLSARKQAWLNQWVWSHIGLPA
ncbi:DNA mismatch repair protein MutT [Novimethylophilus kurashikiensis]|uniref:DNA mismatch repair protein MutT n=1 Tax=Novimethylophilus kurashikiensis TaxID=1825523 RepID=A0A2R5FD85_9PROT|nr:NUDIX hydrolase [Novimethylophilus kurashikiensis]GBG14853.1 DNA mismatch repair protein MutT [Novimethylophilus kurashikiensis]